MGNCHGTPCSSQPSNWPERGSPFLQFRVDTSRTSTQVKPSHYGTVDALGMIHMWGAEKLTFLSLSLSFRKLYSDKNGKLLKAGEIVKFEKLADTLETIARDGPNAFYTGKIAEDLIRDIQEAGIVRQDSSCFLFQPFSMCAWHNDLITNEQINWVCKALQRS